MNTKAATTAGHARSLSKTRILRYTACEATTYAAIDISEPDNPVRYRYQFHASNACNTCGSGSHTPPNWAIPGVVPETTRRPISRWEYESLIASVMWWCA